MKEKAWKGGRGNKGIQENMGKNEGRWKAERERFHSQNVFTEEDVGVYFGG